MHTQAAPPSLGYNAVQPDIKRSEGRSLSPDLSLLKHCTATRLTAPIISILPAASPDTAMATKSSTPPDSSLPSPHPSSCSPDLVGTKKISPWLCFQQETRGKFQFCSSWTSNPLLTCPIKIISILSISSRGPLFNSADILIESHGQCLCSCTQPLHVQPFLPDFSLTIHTFYLLKLKSEFPLCRKIIP